MISMISEIYLLGIFPPKMAQFQAVDYVIFSLMLLISLGIGVFQAFTRGRQRTTNEYLMGNRHLKLAPVALSICVSMISGKALVYTLFLI